MINQRLFYVGDPVYCLLYAGQDSNFLYPIKAIIRDVQHDTTDPIYLIEILKFYDNYTLIKDKFASGNFRYRFNETSCRKWRLPNFDSIEDLQNKIQEEGSRHYLVIDSLFVYKFKGDMLNDFNKLQDFLIHKEIRRLKDLTTRNFYTGKYKKGTAKEFFIQGRSVFMPDIISDEDFNKEIYKF